KHLSTDNLEFGPKYGSGPCAGTVTVRRLSCAIAVPNSPAWSRKAAPMPIQIEHGVSSIGDNHGGIASSRITYPSDPASLVSVTIGEPRCDAGHQTPGGRPLH